MKILKGKKGVFISILLILMLILGGCAGEQTDTEQGSDEGTENNEVEKKEIILSTTTSTENSGLLDFILPDFTEMTGIDVKVVAVGTGNAIQMGEDGEADVLLVHAKASEEEFVEAGHGLE